VCTCTLLRRDLHGSVRIAIEEDGLLEPIDEWDQLIQLGCTLKPHANAEHEVEVTAVAPMLQFDEIMQQLVPMFGCLFPNTSEDEREEAVRQGLVLQSHSTCTDASRCVGCENTHGTPCSRMGDYLAPYMVLCSFSVDTSICNSSLCELQCVAVWCSVV